MKHLAVTTVLLILHCCSQAQLFGSGGPNQYEIEGFIIKPGNDTMKGMIVLEVYAGDVNYGKLANGVVFIDSLGKKTKYSPSKLSGFGLRDDAIKRDYVSIALREKAGGNLFLKKLVSGKVQLLEQDLSKERGGITYPSPGVMMNNKPYLTNKVAFYLKEGGADALKLELNPKTGAVRKKDLRQILSFLPEEFHRSDEELYVHDLIPYLEAYNLKHPQAAIEVQKIDWLFIRELIW